MLRYCSHTTEFFGEYVYFKHATAASCRKIHNSVKTLAHNNINEFSTAIYLTPAAKHYTHSKTFIINTNRKYRVHESQ